jgi:gluconate 2-dehydrogenase gamma chain
VITRRRFVKLVGGAAALAALPVGCGDNATVTSGLYFDHHQWVTIDLVTGFIVPSDGEGAGAREAKAVRYIDRLLASFEGGAGIYAGGPFSGRVPYPTTAGTASNVFPPASFGKFLPLSRVHEIAWRMRIYGSAQTPGGDFNDALLGPRPGWRQMYRDAITLLDAGTTPWRFLDVGDQSTILYTVATELPDWWQAIVEHTLEGMFAAPEYGGNDGLSGWDLAQYDGDSAPLGHAYYDKTIDAYRDRADQPTSQPSPGAQTEDFSPEVLDELTVAAIGSGGKRFF